MLYPGIYDQRSDVRSESVETSTSICQTISGHTVASQLLLEGIRMNVFWNACVVLGIAVIGSRLLLRRMSYCPKMGM